MAFWADGFWADGFWADGFWAEDASPPDPEPADDDDVSITASATTSGIIEELMATVSRSSRRFKVTPAHNGEISDLGPATANASLGTFVIQFITSEDFVGSFAVLGRAYGQNARDAEAQMMSIPYRRANVNGVASDYKMVGDVISGPGLIQIPANGLAIGLLVECSAGECEVVSWPLQGSSAV